MRKTCLDWVHKLAKEDPRVVFVGSDLSPGLLKEMKAEFPDRWYMEGIAEQNVVGLAAGMALEGFIPYANTIATFFSRRSYEQVAIDLCLHNVPVRLISNGGGLVYAPLGPTHLAIEDMAIMRALPNMTVVACCDAEEMKRFMDASLTWPGPIYIRLAKGGDAIVSRPENGFEIGRAITMRRSTERRPVVLMTTGVMTTNALGAAEILGKEGHDVSVVHFHTVKPLDTAAVLDHARSAKLVVTVEEGIAIGGFGSAVTDVLVEELGPSMPRVKRIALPDAFPKNYGVQKDLFEIYGLLPEQIAGTVMDTLGRFEKRRDGQSDGAMFLIVGGDSDIGRAAATAFRAQGREVIGTTRRADTVGPDAVHLDLAHVPADWVPPAGVTTACIAAAVARLAACDADPEGSARVNCTGAIDLAARLTARGIYTLFLSTNQVFDGLSPNVAADTPAAPNSTYGRQKARTEAALREMMARGAPAGILRLSKVVFPGLKLFSDWYDNLLTGKPVRAFSDMTLAPVPADLVVQAIGAMTKARAATVAQLTGPRDITYFEAARHVAAFTGANPALVEAGRAADIGLPPGSTPVHTTLDCGYLRDEHGIVVPSAIQVIDNILRPRA